MRLVLIAADPVPQDPERLDASPGAASVWTRPKAGPSPTASTSACATRSTRPGPGELPRTVMIDREGKATVLPGVADLAAGPPMARRPIQVSLRSMSCSSEAFHRSPRRPYSPRRRGRKPTSSARSRSTSRGRAPPAPTAKAGGGFVTITNKGTTPDRLIAARSTASDKVEIHEMKMDGNVMRMRELDKGLEIPPGATVTLKPGGFTSCSWN